MSTHLHPVIVVTKSVNNRREAIAGLRMRLLNMSLFSLISNIGKSSCRRKNYRCSIFMGTEGANCSVQETFDGAVTKSFPCQAGKSMA
jgi:hypothetical protein